jgi:hypothetical protein
MEAIVTQPLIVNWRKKTVKEGSVVRKGGETSDQKRLIGRCVAAIFRIMRSTLMI